MTHIHQHLVQEQTHRTRQYHMGATNTPLKMLLLDKSLIEKTDDLRKKLTLQNVTKY